MGRLDGEVVLMSGGARVRESSAAGRAARGGFCSTPPLCGAQQSRESGPIPRKTGSSFCRLPPTEREGKSLHCALEVLRKTQPMCHSPTVLLFGTFIA